MSRFARRLLFPPLTAALLMCATAGTAQAAFPGANGKIVFASQVSTDNYNIVVVDSDGANPTVLAEGANPAFSPDGQKIVFVDRGGNLTVMNVDGSGKSDLGQQGGWPAFSPDGRKIAFSDGKDIFVINVSGSNPTRLTNAAVTPPARVSNITPVFSPDGQKIVFQGFRSPDSFTRGTNELYSIDSSDGSDETQLTTGGAGSPSFSPDGQKIVFSLIQSGTEGESDVFVVNADGSNKTQLTTNPELDQDPAFSPDGQKIVFSSQGGNSSARLKLYVMNPDGSGQTALTTPASTGATVSDRNPDWGSVGTLEVTLFGAALGFDDSAFLRATLANVSADGAITGLTYPGGPGSGLIFNTAHHSPANRGELGLVAGPRPLLPSSLEASSSTFADYVVEVTRPGIVQVRVEAEGTDHNGNKMSDKGVVEVIATDRVLDVDQKRAIFAGAYVDYTSRVQKIADKEMKQFFEQLRKALPSELKSEGKKTSNREDLLAELYGLPPGSLSFLPPQVSNYLLFCEARSQGEWNAWQRRIGSSAEKTVKVPLQFWDNQFSSEVDPATKFKVGQELYAIASEKTSGLASATGTFARDSFSLIDAKAPREIAAGLPILVGEAAGKAKATFDISKAELQKLQKAFNESDQKGIKATAELLSEKEVALHAAIAKAAVGELTGTAALKQLGRLYKAGKGVDAVDGPVPSSLDDILARTIDDNGIPPTAKELGMGTADQARIKKVISELEAEAAALGYPGLKLEMSFRSRGYSAPGAIGKNQFVSTKTGSAIDLLLGMHKSGLGENAIYRPKLPKHFDRLPQEIKTQLKQRHDDQLGYYKAWQAAERGEKSKLSGLHKATRKGGHTYTNEVKGVVTSTTKMEIGTVKKGNTTLLRYQQLEVDGRKIVKGRATAAGTPIGSDYDGVMLGLVGGKPAPAGIQNALWLRANRKFAKLAADEGFAWGFHGFSANGFDFGKDLFHAKIWQYIAEAMPEDAARKAFGNQAEDVLKQMTFGQYLVKVTAEGAGTGPHTR